MQRNEFPEVIAYKDEDDVEQIFKGGKNIFFLTYIETAQEQEERVRGYSKYGKLKTWKLARIIVKSGDDLR